MSRVRSANLSVLRRNFLPSASYQGSGGTVWFAGFELRAPSIAAYYCGDDARPSTSGRVWRRRVPGRITDIAAAGGLPILQIRERDEWFTDVLHGAIAVPARVDIHTHLPADLDTLRSQLLTSTTREDFRRIRRANFSYRVTSDPDAIREFHAHHYTPLVERQFPDDGLVVRIDTMLDDLDHGGELVCADIEDDWVAGILNVPNEENYALMRLGIRDADDAVRQKRVVAALIIRSLERAVELGHDRATLGRSLPFLGKGPVWFKAKWGGTVTRRPGTLDMHMFMDIRQPAVRRMLAATPVIHTEGDTLVVSSWLEPGPKPLQATIRDARRFPGISRWYVLGEPETLAACADQLRESERITPIPLAPLGDRPLWLGEALPNHAV